MQVKRAALQHRTAVRRLAKRRKLHQTDKRKLFTHNMLRINTSCDCCCRHFMRLYQTSHYC